MKAIELEKAYDPKSFEERIYKDWESKGYFKPASDEDSPVHCQCKECNEKTNTYAVVIPPPNVTGVLHMGHGLNNTLQDIVVRYHRMKGDNTLWVTGTDHAGIATQNVVERQLKKEGKSRNDLGREKFIERTWEVKENHHNIICNQQRKLGNSTDWERERFTMDEGLSKAVRDVFVTLYERGLMYKGKRLVNWCPRCGTALADDEVDHEDTNGAMYHIFYEYADGSGKIEVATTRPETFFGDTAVAVNPNDERYKAIVGKMLKLPITGKEIPIVADDYVDMEFGTGMVKITPAHDPNDWEVGLRHNLEVVNLLTPDGRMNENVPEKYRGLKPEEARKLVVEDLEAAGLFKEEEKMVHSVGKCYRCKTVVEPYLSDQWFVKMKPMAEKALESWRKGELVFYPKKWENTYSHWMENIRDWCVSRQIWWGHRIPAWYCDDCGETIVSKTDVTVCPKCGSTHLRQDEDTLDTWFSSALWPFSTLGWPEQTEDLKHYYPTNTLVTGYDIIGFWVSRMIFSALEYTGQVPFDTVLIHGLVRDAQGRKMSKSLGNGIDPLEIIDQYGADALRFTLATGNSPGNDMRFSDEKVEASRNFANKIWNAARFILMNLDENEYAPYVPKNLAIEDKWILSKYNDLVKDVTDSLEKFELGLAVQKLYDFIWDVFCDWYIEIVKIRLNGECATAKATVKAVLVYVMSNTLKLLHPFMPFITEEIWQTLPHDGDSIMISEWPVFTDELSFKADENEMERVMTAIKAVRNRRAEMNVPPSKKAKIFIETAYEKTFSEGANFFVRLASASEVEIVKGYENDEAVAIITEDARLFIPMDELVDFKAELERLEKEKASVLKEIAFVSGKLNNAGFVAKAPEAVVNEQREKLAKYNEKLSMLEESIAKISNK